MLAIRVDGNSDIGLGHIMRCLSIAGALRGLGQECLFFVSEDNWATQRITDQGFKLIVTPSKYNSIDEELDFMPESIKAYEISLLLIDSYYVTKRYMGSLQSLAKIAYIDDLNAFLYPCDILINYSKYAGVFNYEKTYSQTKLLLGCDYVPLREEFYHLQPKRINESVSDIILLTGGTDPYHFAAEFLNEAVRVLSKAININVIVSTLSAEKAELERLAAAHSNIHILYNVQNISYYMQKADLAVSAAGTTLYELSACGTPTICYVLSDNQFHNAQAFSEDGTMLYAGDIQQDLAETVRKCISNIELLCPNSSKRRKVSIRMQSCVDGKGALRLAKALLQ